MRPNRTCGYPLDSKVLRSLTSIVLLQQMQLLRLSLRLMLTVLRHVTILRTGSLVKN
jgi:hypothetical protein